MKSNYLWAFGSPNSFFGPALKKGDGEIQRHHVDAKKNTQDFGPEKKYHVMLFGAYAD